jgi:solute:Na+ symporter, SSS family
METLCKFFNLPPHKGKTHMLDFSFDLTIMTFWVFLLAIPGAPNESVSAQYIVQRFISTKSYKNAAQSMYINSFVGPAVIFVFFILGTAIYMFYQANPGEMNASMRQTDEVMAWFIVQQLPIGISGLMIAAIFAATMSSLDSALSSTSTVFIIDIYKPLKKDLSDDAALRKAKSLTILLGVIGTISALILAAIEVRSLLDYFLQILFLLGGGLAGIF